MNIHGDTFISIMSIGSLINLIFRAILERSNLKGWSDSSLGAMRRSGSFSFAHFYQYYVILMWTAMLISLLDQYQLVLILSFIWHFYCFYFKTWIVGLFPTLRGFIICIQTHITDCWKIMNRIARKPVFGFPIGWYKRTVQPLIMARCINL